MPAWSAVGRTLSAPPRPRAGPQRETYPTQTPAVGDWCGSLPGQLAVMLTGIEAGRRHRARERSSRFWVYIRWSTSAHDERFPGLGDDHRIDTRGQDDGDTVELVTGRHHRFDAFSNDRFPGWRSVKVRARGARRRAGHCSEYCGVMVVYYLGRRGLEDRSGKGEPVRRWLVFRVGPGQLADLVAQRRPANCRCSRK